MSAPADAGIPTALGEYFEELDKVASTGGTGEQHSAPLDTLSLRSGRSASPKEPAPHPGPRGASSNNGQARFERTERNPADSLGSLATFRAVASPSRNPGATDETRAVLADLLQRLRAWTEQEPPASTSRSSPSCSFGMPGQRMENKSEGNEDEVNVTRDVSAQAEAQTLTLQLESVQRQAALLQKECAWVQRLCDELSQEVEQQRQRRLLAEERSQQLAEQLEDLYEESVKQTRSLRLRFEDALEQERASARLLQAELDDLKQQLRISRVDDEDPAAVSSSLASKAEASTSVPVALMPAKRVVSDKACQTEQMSAADVPESSRETIRKQLAVELPILDRYRVSELVAYKPENEQFTTACQHPGHAQLYVELYEALKQRDLWMREAQALAKSLRFFRQAFHYEWPVGVDTK